MKNCTKHSVERWVERVLGIKDIKERDSYIVENSSRIKENMNTTLEYAEFVYKGQIGDNITRHYYLHNDIVFVLNTTNDAIITVYKVDFGFPAEINLQVSKGLIKEIRRLVAEKDEVDFKVLEELEGLKHESDQLAQQEELLRQQLKILQDKKKSVDENIKSVDSSSKIIELDIKRVTNQLVNSKEHKDDIRNM